MAFVRCENCLYECGKHNVPYEILRIMIMEFKKLAHSDSKSLLKKYLTDELFYHLKSLKTSYDSNLLDCCCSGFEILDSKIGIYAADSEAYFVFGHLFNPILKELHFGFSREDNQPRTHWGDISTIEELDPSHKYIISTRVRLARSIEGYPFNSRMTQSQYEEIETKMSATFNLFEGDYEGVYRSLADISEEEQRELLKLHFLFDKSDRFLNKANACRYWPNGRGVFISNDEKFLVWVNEEDHVRVISMQKGSNLNQVYERLVSGLKYIKKDVSFVKSRRLGYLTFCPSNIGTGLKASVIIQLPKLRNDLQKFVKKANQYNLEIRGPNGEHTRADSGVYSIGSRKRLGITEYDVIKNFQDGIFAIIELERSLSYK